MADGVAAPGTGQHRVRGRLPVLWRSATEVQVGTDPRWSVALADLSPATARALSDLPPGADLRVLRAGLRGAATPASEAQDVVAHLRAAGLLVTSPPPQSADDAAWALMAEGGRGASVLRGRAHRTVRVTGLGRLGTVLSVTLAAAGVGTVEPADDRTVTRHDVGLGGLTARDVGGSRRGAVARLLHDIAPAVRTGTGVSAAGVDPPAPDLVVLVEHGVADPVRHRDLMDAGVAHLSVVVREASVLVGPLVQPGRSVCLHCLDLHRAQADPGWPAIATQLVATPPGPEETTLAAVSAALGAAQALAYLDGRPTAVHEASITVTLPDALPRRTAWAVHPDCGWCGPGTT